jgi:hypothetical protein
MSGLLFIRREWIDFLSRAVWLPLCRRRVEKLWRIGEELMRIPRGPTVREIALILHGFSTKSPSAPINLGMFD